VSKFTTENYHKRFQRVIEYIDENLENDLSLDILCGVAAFSKYHFHRQFYAMFGINITKYITLFRLNRAAHKLVYRTTAITEIAYDSGYDSPEAFARSFKRYFEQTPSNFRKRPNWEHWKNIYTSLTQIRTTDMHNNDVEIIDFPETSIAVLEHRGDPNTIMTTLQRFINWRKENALPPAKSATYNILYDNPNDVETDKYRMGIAAQITNSIKDNNAGIIEKTIPAGRCAKLRHIGSDNQLSNMVAYLYAEWLPQSGFELRDYPIFLQRVKFFPDVCEHETIIDIFLPIL